MNSQLIKWYKNTRSLIDSAKGKEEHPNVKDLYNEWIDTIKQFDRQYPDLKTQYEGYKRIQESFTSEQIDFICYQIGDWYIEWENKMWINDKPNQHWLGVAKEGLKTMICGD